MNKFYLNPESYTLKNALTFEFGARHWDAGQSCQWSGRKIMHCTIGVFEKILIVSQIVSLVELLIFKIASAGHSKEEDQISTITKSITPTPSIVSTGTDFEQLAPISPNISADNGDKIGGNGPSLFQSATAVANTAILRLFAPVHKTQSSPLSVVQSESIASEDDFKDVPSQEQIEKEMLAKREAKKPEYIKTLSTPGQMLDGELLDEILRKLATFKDFQVINTFFIGAQSFIDTVSFDEIISKLKEQANQLSKPICIPVCFQPKNYFSVPHITVILIHKGVIEFYDSQGYTSENKQLKDGKTLRDLLDKLAEHFKTHSLEQNAKPHQPDSHSCGVMVARYVDKRLREGISCDELGCEEVLSNAQVADYRETLVRVLKAKTLEEIEETYTLEEDQ